MTQLSLITVNYRSWAHLGNLVSDVADAPELKDGRWELIVVDNHSNDGELESFQTRFPWVRFIVNSGNFGFAHGNNLGAGHASGDQFLFLNPDVRAEPAAIRTLLAVRRSNPEVSLLSAKQLSPDGKARKAFDRFPNLLTYIRTFKSLLRKIERSRLSAAKSEKNGLVICDWISGSLVLIDRSDFERLGGWSEEFWMYAEDMDLGRRAADLGMTSACTYACSFVHAHGGASRRDDATTLLTKQEVMISAHVYIQRHFAGPLRFCNHAIVIMRNLAPLTVAAVFNLVTLGLSAGLRRRALLLRNMLAYYFSAFARRTWLSPRSVRYPDRHAA